MSRTLIGPHSVIGLVHEKDLRLGDNTLSVTGEFPSEPNRVSIGDETIIGAFVCIHQDTRIGAFSSIDDYTRIGHSTSIGDRTKVTYSAIIGDEVVIGSDCIIAGFVCDNTTIHDHCTVMGNLVHKYDRPHLGWWDVDEVGPTIHNNTIVSYNANIVGDVEVGPYSYICNGALLTKNVPPFHVCYGTNEIVHYRNWKGDGLNSLFEHWETLSHES